MEALRLSKNEMNSINKIISKTKKSENLRPFITVYCNNGCQGQCDGGCKGTICAKH